MTWTTVSLKVTTPLFNGGASPADEAGLRVASLRGAMRYWFRALAGSVIGPDLRRLSAVESRVFGSAEHSSPLVLRIASQPQVVRPTDRASFLADPSLSPAERRWIIYLLGQSLGDMREVKLLRPYVAPGSEIKLKIRFRHHVGEGEQARKAIESLTYASLWLTCAYGGVGARARRGFGAVRIAGADGALPGPWTADSIVTPGAGHYKGLTSLWSRGVLSPCVPEIAILTGKPIANPREIWGGKPPLFPVLSTTHAPARISAETFASWQKTMIWTGESLRRYRADTDNASPAANYRPKLETREWLDVVHGNDDRFQLGALGLPVVYKGNRTVRVAKVPGGDELRRASPLWLRPVGEGGRWQLLSFAFRAEFLPEAARAGVRLGNRDLSVTDQDVLEVTGAWIDALADGRTPQRPPTS
ncbi:MAG TPA: type III-B CRISPR module RAMP protein Cmr1 [Streptosporangiaceae bacterium]|nr:type III-B CRISPR module RAMP protein Cmr1 [Streptosporangiaceae bacterium]